MNGKTGFLGKIRSKSPNAGQNPCINNGTTLSRTNPDIDVIQIIPMSWSDV
jgi:hypothetical protein